MQRWRVPLGFACAALFFLLNLFSRRSRKRSLDELVAAALIVHPAYVHPRLHVPMEAEDALALVVAMRHASLGRAAVQKSAGPASR